MSDRLVFICSDTAGGVRTYITNLGTFLKGKGLGYLVVTHGASRGMRTQKLKDAEGHSIAIRYSRFASKPSIYKTLAGCFDPGDILVCSDSLELETVNFLGLPNKVFFLLHGDLEHYNSLLQQYARVIDHVSCVSHGLKNKYSALYPALSFSVSHPLTDNFKGSPKSSRPPLMAAFIGRFEYMKGADVFTDVARRSAENRLPLHFKLFITKKGSDEKLLATLPSTVEVIFDAPNVSVLEALENTDILLFPSRSEGFGIAVLEGMKRGVVPLARNLPIGVPDMVTDKETGRLADSPEEMMAAIGGWLDDTAALEELKLRTMRFANEAFDYDKMGERFLDNVRGIPARPAGADKQYYPVQQALPEKLLPEAFYRLVKFLHHRIKYGNSE